MNIQDNFSKSLETVLGLKILKFFDANPDPESFWSWIRDGKIQKSGIRIKHPGSGALLFYNSLKIQESRIFNPIFLAFDPTWQFTNLCPLIKMQSNQLSTGGNKIKYG